MAGKVLLAVDWELDWSSWLGPQFSLMLDFSQQGSFRIVRPNPTGASPRVQKPKP